MTQSILITGCSSGFGRDLAVNFATQGQRVGATMRDPNGRNREAAEGLRERARSGGWTLEILDLDVTSDASVSSAVAAFEGEFGTPDVVINNAGQMYGGLSELFTPEEFTRQLDVNVVGVHRVTRAVLPKMRERGRGLLVNISSVAGRFSMPFFGVYHASKWALEGYSQALRAELATSGVDVVLVEPGPFATELFQGTVHAEDAEQRASTYPPAVNGAYEEMGQAFEGIFADPEAPTDPAIVVQGVTDLVAMAPGTRPLRTCFGLDFGVVERNEASAPFDQALYESMGMLGLQELKR